jgi:tetratricopeptide (TPR) repeat protein
MNVRKLIALTVLLQAGSLAVRAEGTSNVASLTEIFEAGNIAASQGDYPAAIRSYSVLMEAGITDPDVCFNLATAYAQAGDYPRAILGFERALVLRPGDDQAEENLRAAERALEEQRAEAEGEAMIHGGGSPAEALYRSLPEDLLAYGLLAANLVFFGCLAWTWATRRKGRWLLGLLIASGALFAFSAIGLGQKAGVLRDGPRVVALEDRVPLREGPYLQARARGEARGGDRGVALDRDGDFLRVRLVSRVEGWAPASAVGIIDPHEGLH